MAAAERGTRFFLFADDDVLYHASTVETLVGALEADPSALMATGYPFDVPRPGASFWTLCIMVARKQGAVRTRTRR